MGICASSQTTSRGGTMKWPPTTMVIDMDGGFQEYKPPIKAGHVLTQNPNCFLCSSETMFLGSHAPRMTDNEELQLGQIYFLMPITKSQTPLSLQDLCALAIKASAALNNSVFWPFSDIKKNIRFPAGPPASCKVWTSFDMAEMSSPAVVRGGRGLEFYDQQS